MSSDTSDFIPGKWPALQMVLSHKYKFILIKTRKTPGSSIQIYLSRFCGENDIVSPIDMPEQPYTPRNFRGLYNPLPDIAERGSFHEMMKVLGRFFTFKKFQSHIKVREARRRVSRDIWEGNFKFAVERNPWDKALSHYHFVRQRYRKYDENISFEKYLEVADLPFNNKKYTDESGKIIVDSVLRYENLNEELADVFGMLGVPFGGSLGATEKSHYRRDRRHYKDVYTPDRRYAVEKLFSLEIELLGYEF